MNKTLLVVAAVMVATDGVRAQKDTIYKQQTLKEVVVSSTKKNVEFTSQGTSYRVDGLMGQNSSLYDIVASLPGVRIDSDGNITIHGKSGGEIFIDGRPTHLSGNELATLLRTMPATDADKVDVITQPSAKYDAAGTSGIIDIHSKRIKLSGMNVNVTMRGNIGRTGGGDGSVSVNYKTKHWNPYFSYSYYNHKHVIDLTIDRAFFQERMRQNSFRNHLIVSHDIQFGCDYMPNDRAVINAYMKCGLNQIDEDAVMQSMTQQSGVTAGNVSNSNRDRINLTTGINFQKHFDAEGIWSGSADYFLFRSDQQQNLFSEVPDTTVGNMTGRIHILSLKTDLTLPLTKKWNVEGGLKMSNVWIRNGFRYSMAKQADTQFDYDENIYASYLQTNYQKGKWKMTTGVRMETTHYHIYSEDRTGGRDTTRLTNTVNLFPSFNVIYTINKTQSITLSYSKRIKRPNYGDMNPFVYIFDNYTVESGNTELKPACSHNVELSYMNRKIGQITALMTWMKDPLIKGFEIDNNERVSTFRRNFTDYLSTGLRYQAMVNIIKPWSVSAFLACMYNRYHWYEDHMQRTNQGLTPMLSISQSYQLPFSLTAEMKTDFHGRMAYGQVTAHNYATVNISLQKKICDKRGTITLFANDIFNTQRDKLSMVIGGKSAWCQTLNHVRLIGIGFSWKFQKGTDMKENKQKNTIDEINRVNL